MKFLSLFLLIGSAVATLRGGVSHQQVLSVGEETKPSDNIVTFVYIRHGQSSGNAKRFWQAADGRLTFKGKMDAVRGVTRGGIEKTRILCGDPDHTLYAMSPLRRTTATFIITYIWACRDIKAKTIEFPNIENVEIWISLREKRKSSSEDANSGWHGGKDYILHEATKECKTLIKHDALKKDQLAKCTAFGTALAAKWEAVMKNNEEKVEGKTKLVSNKGQFLAQMENLSKQISSSVESHVAEIKTVIAVAHSGTGRIRLGCPMAAGPNKSERFSDPEKEENLILGMVPKGRKTLGNGGSMILKVDVSGPDAQVIGSGAFYEMEDDKKPMPFAGSLSVSDGTDVYTKECITFGVIPGGSVFTKAEGFLYSGDDYSNKNLLGIKSMKRVSEKSASQATFSHSPGKKSSLSFTGDFGGKLMSKISYHLDKCTATRYDEVKVEIKCTATGTYKDTFPKFAQKDTKAKFKTAEDAKAFEALFNIYKVL